MIKRHQKTSMRIKFVLLFIALLLFLELSLIVNAARHLTSDDDLATTKSGRVERLERIQTKYGAGRTSRNMINELSSEDESDEDETQSQRRQERQRRRRERFEKMQKLSPRSNERREENNLVTYVEREQESHRSTEHSVVDNQQKSSVLPDVHILNIPSGVGLGQVVMALVPILETLRRSGYETFSVHECGLEPPWLRKWNKLISCEERPEKHNIYNNFKRTYETRGEQSMIDVVLKYNSFKDSNEVDHLDGFSNDWNDILSSKTAYGSAKKMLLLQRMHNKYASYAYPACENMKYWFDEPVRELLDLVQKPESEMHTKVTFHIRTFADEHVGIAFDENLIFNEDLAEQERDKNKPNEPRINIVKQALEFPEMVKKMVEVCTFLFEKTGKKTHVAADSQVVRKYLQKYDSIIHMTAPDILDFEKNYLDEPLYSLNDIADWYLLSLGRVIIGFPSGSTYSHAAACRGGGDEHHVHDLSTFTDVLTKVMESDFIK